MRYSQKTFDQAVWKTVCAIKPGQVMSYGAVARAAGFAGYARMVSQAMRRSPTPLPWHRVVKSDRTLAFDAGSEAYREQQRLLEKEGVRIRNGKVVSREPNEGVDLDRLIWGPADV